MTTSLPIHDDLSALMIAVRAGDRAAFARLYALTSPRFLGMAMMLVRRRDLAEDALQDAYLRIWAKAASYDPARGTPLPWLVRIVRNAAIDRLKRERGGHESLDDSVEVLMAASADPGFRLDFERGLATLSGDQRQAMLLLHEYGLTSDEIAARLGEPVSTVKSRLRRAALRLGRHFAADGDQVGVAA